MYIYNIYRYVWRIKKKNVINSRVYVLNSFFILFPPLTTIRNFFDNFSLSLSQQEENRRIVYDRHGKHFILVYNIYFIINQPFEGGERKVLAKPLGNRSIRSTLGRTELAKPKTVTRSFHFHSPLPDRFSPL